MSWLVNFLLSNFDGYIYTHLLSLLFTCCTNSIEHLVSRCFVKCLIENFDIKIKPKLCPFYPSRPLDPVALHPKELSTCTPTHTLNYEQLILNLFNQKKNLNLSGIFHYSSRKHTPPCLIVLKACRLHSIWIS